MIKKKKTGKEMLTDAMKSKAKDGIKKTGSYQGKSNKLGGGGRFAQLKSKLKGKVSNPGAVAAFIGRKKYGAKKFAKLSAKGKK